MQEWHASCLVNRCHTFGVRNHSLNGRTLPWGRSGTPEDPRVLILLRSAAGSFLGGGMAGVSAVVALRERGFTGRITLTGAEEHLPYEPAGDLTQSPNPTCVRRTRVERWQNARHHAAHAASATLGQGNQHHQLYDEIPWAWTDQYESRWGSAGLTGSDMDVVRRGSRDSAERALWFFSSWGRSYGAIAVNRRRELRAVRLTLGRGPIFATNMRADRSIDLTTVLSGVGAPNSTVTT